MSTTYQGSVANYVNTLKQGRTTNNEQLLQAFGQAIGEIYTNDAGEVRLATQNAFTDTTASTSTITGSNTFAGGVGIAKELFVSTTTPFSVSAAGVVAITNATDATTSTTGALKVTGGVGIAKELYVGLSVNAATYVTSGNGTVSLPAIGPVSDPNTGFYFDGTDNVLVSCNGAKVLDIGTTGLAVTGGISVTAGASITGAIGFTTVSLGGLGTVGAPAYSFTDAATQGMYSISGTQLGFAVGGVLVGGWNATGAFTDIISEQTSTVGVTVDGALIKDGSFTGKQATATSTATGLTTGALTGADQFVTVTSASANDCICLPLDSTCPIGTVIRGWVGANGFELRSIAADVTLTCNNVTMGTREAAIPATTRFKVEKVATLTWLLTAVDEVGAVITAIIPDPQ